MPLELPPLKYDQTRALVLKNHFGDPETATNIALANDLVHFFGGLGASGPDRVALMFRVMGDVALAISRNDPDCGIVVEVARDNGELKLTISSDAAKLDAACSGRDERLIYVAMPAHVREYFSRQPQYAREG